MLSREIASACFLYFRLFVYNNFSQAFRPRGTGPWVDVSKKSRACARVVSRSKKLRSKENLVKERILNWCKYTWRKPNLCGFFVCNNYGASKKGFMSFFAVYCLFEYLSCLKHMCKRKFKNVFMYMSVAFADYGYCFRWKTSPIRPDISSVATQTT